MGSHSTRVCLATALLLAFAAPGCVYLNSQVDYEPGVDWAGYETFSVERARPMEANSEATAVIREFAWVDERTQARITQVLERKGMWSAVAAEADLNFRYHYVAREEMHTHDRPGYWRYYDVEIREIRTDSYTRGTLVVDVIDRKQNLLVWHGAIEGVVETPESPGEHLDRNLERAVDLLLENQFPPRWPKPSGQGEMRSDDEA